VALHETPRTQSSTAIKEKVNQKIKKKKKKKKKEKKKQEKDKREKTRTIIIDEEKRGQLV